MLEPALYIVIAIAAAVLLGLVVHAQLPSGDDLDSIQRTIDRSAAVRRDRGWRRRAREDRRRRRLGLAERERGGRA